MNFEDAKSKHEFLMSEDRIRIEFSKMGKECPLCRSAFLMVVYEGYPLSAGLFLVVEEMRRERDKLREMVLEYHMKNPAPSPFAVNMENKLTDIEKGFKK